MATAIDVTPTWAELVQTFFVVLEHGNEEGKHAIRKEIERMAQAADMWNAHVLELRKKGCPEFRGHVKEC